MVGWDPMWGGIELWSIHHDHGSLESSVDGPKKKHAHSLKVVLQSGFRILATKRIKHGSD